MNGKPHILVLGAGGYLGSRMAASFDPKLFRVSGTFNRELPDPGNPGAAFYKRFTGDLSDHKNWKALSAHQFDYILNFISLDHSDSEKMELAFVQQVNINIIDKIFRYLDLSNCKRLVNISSVQVYGAYAGVSMSEKNSPHPANMYGLSHFFKEKMLEYYAKKNGISHVNVRLSNVYGIPVRINKSFEKLVYNDFCYNAIKNKKIEILSDGTPCRDFIYIEDVLRGIEHFMTLKPLDNGTFNLSSAKSVSLLSLANKIKSKCKELFDSDVSVIVNKINNSFNYENTISHYNNSLTGDTGFQFQYGLETGLNDFLPKLKEMIEN